jgi:integral membrane protein
MVTEHWWSRDFPLGPASERGRSRRAVLGALKRYRIMADIVGVGLIILVFVGIPLQYGAGNKSVVEVVGPIHGFAYIVYLASAYDLARRSRWTILQVVSVIVAGFVPFLAFVAEHYTSVRVRRQLDSNAVDANGQGVVDAAGRQRRPAGRGEPSEGA